MSASGSSSDSASAPIIQAVEQNIEGVLGFCMRCKQKKLISNAKLCICDNGRERVEGKCVQCEAKVSTFLKKIKDAEQIAREKKEQEEKDKRREEKVAKKEAKKKKKEEDDKKKAEAKAAAAEGSPKLSDKEIAIGVDSKSEAKKTRKSRVAKRKAKDSSSDSESSSEEDEKAAKKKHKKKKRASPQSEKK